VITPRNRAAFTAVPLEGVKPVVARGSIKVPADVSDEHEFLLGLYLDRTSGTTITREDLISPRLQWEENADLVSIPRTVRVNLEPDMKRRLIEPTMVEIGGGVHAGRQHLATGSVPFDTVEEMLETRQLFERWRHSTGRCLKDLDDFADWVDFAEGNRAARSAGRRPHRTAGGSADDLKRQFLRALVRAEWGVELGHRSYKEVAEWLTVGGYRTSEASVKNAKRGAGKVGAPQRGDAPLVPHSVAVTDATVALLRVILSEYPNFDYHLAFVAGHAERLEESLAKRRRIGGKG